MPDIAYPGSRARAGQLNNLRHTVSFTALTSDTGASTSTTEIAAITTPSITFKSGRAYRVSFKGRMISSASSDQGQLSIRKGSTSGTIILSTYRFQSGSPAGTYGFNLEQMVVNTTGSDVSQVLIACFNRVSGSGSVKMGGSPSDPSFVHVEEYGPVSDYSGAASIT